MTAEEHPKASSTSRMADKLNMRRAYVTGHGSVERLSESMSIPYGTAKQWCLDENWPRLKARYDQKQLDRLLGPEPEPQQDSSPASVTQKQLNLVDEALLACTDASEMDKLARAKLSLMEALHIEKHGAKPGTQRPARATKRTMAPVQPLGEAE